MDSREAKLVADRELERLRARPFAELTRYLDPDNTETREVEGPSGKSYYVEAAAAWTDASETALKLSVLVDNGGFRAFFPLVFDAIVTPSDLAARA